MDADRLTDAWEAGAVFPGGVSHRDHLRIAWTLFHRHPPAEARRRLLDGTERACIAHGCPEKFDHELTLAWTDAIEAAARETGWHDSADAFLEANPSLLDTRRATQNVPQPPVSRGSAGRFGS